MEIISQPEQSPRGHWFFFVRDFDGNLIEMIDLRHMYYVLRWLGPLSGWLFQQGDVQGVLREGRWRRPATEKPERNRRLRNGSRVRVAGTAQSPVLERKE